MARLYSDQPQFDSINIPPEQNFNTAAMNGSLQQFLADNLGEYVIVEFLVGTQTMTQKAGVLYAVGSSVLTLYEEVSQTFITCDIFSVKFVTFFLPGHRPWQANHPCSPPTGCRAFLPWAARSLSPAPLPPGPAPTAPSSPARPWDKIT